jgi:hypothetical protein
VDAGALHQMKGSLFIANECSSIKHICTALNHLLKNKMSRIIYLRVRSKTFTKISNNHIYMCKIFRSSARRIYLVIYIKENIDRLVRKEKLNSSGTELQSSFPPSQKIKEKNKQHPKNVHSRKQVKKQHTNCSRGVLEVQLVLCLGHDSV